jgi:hypothetical protein
MKTSSLLPCTAMLAVISIIIIHSFGIGREDMLSFIQKLHCSAGYHTHLSAKDLTQAIVTKIYTPVPLNHAMIFRNKYPGEKSEFNSTILSPLKGWFRIHNEYLASVYLIHRLLHDKSISTNNISEADLCFPNCLSDKSVSITGGNTLQLHVKPGSEAKFYGCTVLNMGIDTPTSTCSFNVPYWHSIYYPFNQALEPWRYNFTRSNHLCYAGGVRRGHARGRVLSELRGSGTIKFTSFDVKQTDNTEDEEWATPHFYVKIWELYASSDFSWQPEGDSSTRRGFYDSWMLGCIPVISRSAYCVYNGLFGGFMFSTPRPTLESIVIVLDDEVMMHGKAIIWHLSRITADDIAERRNLLADLAPLMQWGWNERSRHADALIGALNAFTHFT